MGKSGLQSFGKAARDKVVRNYTPEIVARHYINLYQDVLNRCKSA